MNFPGKLYHNKSEWKSYCNIDSHSETPRNKMNFLISMGFVYFLGGLETPNVPRKSALASRIKQRRCGLDAAASAGDGAGGGETPGGSSPWEKQGKKVGNPWWIVVNIWL